jgi:hypothetical protein
LKKKSNRLASNRRLQGYPGKFYCPRMATMNKPTYAAIQTHSPTKPALVFVASRRQTRLTALDLIAHAAADERPRAFLRAPDEEMDQLLPLVKDASLRHTLQFGVGLHHAGLCEGDRALVERLFVEGKAQVLVATSTLAWGVNTPAHLVVVKGTEFFDAPTKCALGGGGGGGRLGVGEGAGGEGLRGVRCMRRDLGGGRRVCAARAPTVAHGDGCTMHGGAGVPPKKLGRVSHISCPPSLLSHISCPPFCRRYVDYPITDVLQMMGRAGRPQYDRHGVAVIMVHEPKKSFYKKFLYEPFPVESSLPGQLADHVNAEAVGGTIRSTQDAVDYLTWTFFMRRLLQNPSYYDLDSVAPEAVSSFLSDLVGATLGALEGAGCLAVDEAGGVAVLTPGRIASFYYLRHATLATFARELRPGMGPPDVLRALCAAAEYAELPVRHNEDRLNAGLAAQVRHPPDARTIGEHARGVAAVLEVIGIITASILDRNKTTEPNRVTTRTTPSTTTFVQFLNTQCIHQRNKSLELILHG